MMSVLALVAGLAHAAPAADTTHLGLAVGWHDGPGQVAGGLGPVLGHRHRVDGGALVLAGSAARLWGLVPATALAVELGWARPRGRWTPSVGVELGLMSARLTKVDTAQPRAPWLPPTALRLRLRPLVLPVGDRGELSAERKSVG